jgi:acyl carrier protein
MHQREVADRTEAYVRASFNISPGDAGFGPTADLFHGGYVDSVGLVELLQFIQEEFDVENPTRTSCPTTHDDRGHRADRRRPREVSDVASGVRWPGGKAFAFSIFDDTDLSTLDNAPRLYELLADLGFRTTKSVWPISGTGVPVVGGATCEDRAYAEWVQDLQGRGFEIALHNVAPQTSTREQTIRGIERFGDLFGHDPSAHANHTGCREAIYWGDRRLSGLNQAVYNVLNRGRTRGVSEGHIETSPLFWGDLCRSKVKYVRNFVHGDVNTLGYCPQMPYHDPERPYVNHWFASTEGPRVDSFVGTLSEANQDRLEADGGACIMYTHFGAGFVADGRIDARFERLMRRLSAKDGWFVPVTTLLDFLLEAKGRHVITAAERRALERRWLAHKLRVGPS